MAEAMPRPVGFVGLSENRNRLMNRKWRDLRSTSQRFLELIHYGIKTSFAFKSDLGFALPVSLREEREKLSNDSPINSNALMNDTR